MQREVEVGERARERHLIEFSHFAKASFSREFGVIMEIRHTGSQPEESHPRHPRTGVL